MNTFEKYPGTKTNTGIIQFLCNNMPYHLNYYELCAGKATLFYNKQPAIYRSILLDVNSDIVAWNKKKAGDSATVIKGDAVLFLQTNEFQKNDFIYLDPPYPAAARKSQISLYENEMLTDEQHIQLLTAAKKVKAQIMISSRPNTLYDKHLKGWRKKTFKVSTRGGVVDEVIYMNYPEPALLHEYNHLGTDSWDRLRINRKLKAFADKLTRLPAYEKHVLIQAIIGNDRAAVQHFLTVADLLQPRPQTK